MEHGILHILCALALKGDLHPSTRDAIKLIGEQFHLPNNYYYVINNLTELSDDGYEITKALTILSGLDVESCSKLVAAYNLLTSRAPVKQDTPPVFLEADASIVYEITAARQLDYCTYELIARKKGKKKVDSKDMIGRQFGFEI